MLSRSAQGLYWMGRYLERTGCLCRLLQLQVEALVDRPIAEIHFGWARIYAILDRQPPFDDEFEFDESDDFALADSYTLAGDVTFERSNLESIRSCIALGRENARQIRHCISEEMWTCLNLAWLRIRDLEIEDIWKVSPENFYTRTSREIDTFIGVADATMYRDEGWRFMQLGRFIERAQLLVVLLLAQITAERAPGAAPETGWTTLLRACQAFDAYKRSYSVEVRPDRVLELLVTDPLLPGLAAPFARDDRVGACRHRSEPECARRRRGRAAGRPAVCADSIRMARPPGSAGSSSRRCASTASRSTNS